METTNLRLDAARKLVHNPLVAAAHLVALVALAEQLEGLGIVEIAGTDQEDEVQRRLFLGVQTVLGDVRDVDELAHPAGDAETIEVLPGRELREPLDRKLGSRLEPLPVTRRAEKQQPLR